MSAVGPLTKIIDNRVSDEEPTTAETPPMKNGWGGPRKNSGGARPSSGRKRKPIPSPVSPSMSTPSSPYVTRPFGIRKVTPYGVILRHPGITTGGSLRRFDEAWVYVGLHSDGRVKVGMSSQPNRRCKQLGVSLYFVQPVLSAHAQKLETYALRKLGVQKGGTELVCGFTAEQVAEVVRVAWREMGEVTQVDPHLTQSQAFKQRKATD